MGKEPMHQKISSIYWFKKKSLIAIVQMATNYAKFNRLGRLEADFTTHSTCCKFLKFSQYNN